MELETAACCYACAANSESSDENAASHSEETLCKSQPRLCHRQITIGSSAPQCWKETYVHLRNTIDDILDRTFNDKSAVTVVDWLRGFSSPFERPTLRVEVIDATNPAARPETYIAKMTIADKIRVHNNTDQSNDPKEQEGEDPHKRLEQELKGYAYLCEDGKSASPIFTTLESGCNENGQLQSLKYSDAEHSLRADEAVITLERAVIEACNGGRRSLDAVKATLVQLYLALENACYRNAQTRDPRDADKDYLKERLTKGLRNWMARDTEAGRARNETVWALKNDSLEFIDAALYFNTEDLPPMPQMLVGTSHGDLHGRNVLVGLVEGETHWPVVFDYEDVKCCNPIVWDFVKMETELKKVALADPAFLPAEDDAELIRKLYDFELHLSRKTETCYNHNHWFPSERDKLPESMKDNQTLLHLIEVILAIRRMAWKCLELNRGRSRKWLHEYYFFLAAYSMYAGRFQTYREVRPLKTLFVSAGIAAFRYAFGEDFAELKIGLRKVDAQDRIASLNDRAVNAGQRHADGSVVDQGELGLKPKQVMDSAKDGATNQTGEEEGIDANRKVEKEPWDQQAIRNHRADLEFAKTLARSNNEACIAEAIEEFQRLMNDHPFVVEPAYENALALLEYAEICSDPTEHRKRWEMAERALKRAEVQFRGQLDQELLARRGRYYKNKADHLLKNVKDSDQEDPRYRKQLKEVLTYYGRAAEVYQKATRLSEKSKKYYFAINAATCFYLAGDLPKATENVAGVFHHISEAKKTEDDVESLMWIQATEGEAHVIRGLSGGDEAEHWLDKAKAAYGGALETAEIHIKLQHPCSSMRHQLERIHSATRKRIAKDSGQMEDDANLSRLDELIAMAKEYCPHTASDTSGNDSTTPDSPDDPPADA